jgi:hypothetical protein
MKIRRGFVTNSSSSSYIIGVKEENGTTTKEFDEQLLKWAKNLIFNKDAFKITSIEELNKFFLDSYKDYNDETIEHLLDNAYYLQDKYNKSKQALEKGFVVYACEMFSDCGEDPIDKYNEAFKQLEQCDDFQKIHVEED